MTTNGIALLITIPSMNSNYSLLKRCSPVAPVLWAFAVIAVIILNAHTPVSLVKPVNPKPAVRVVSKAPNNGSQNNTIFFQISNGNISPSRCPICCDLSATITGPYLINFFTAPLVPCSNTPGSLGSKLVFVVPYIPMVANSINIHTFIYLSPKTDSLNMTPGNQFFQKKASKRSGVMWSFSSFETAIFNSNPTHCRASDTSDLVPLPQCPVSTLLESEFCQKTRGAWRNVKYPGRYLKRLPISASQLKHYSGMSGKIIS
ncbi:hypothetical protein EC835_1175 [Providencia alcalifaciens]|uniref:Uncharacterized protein n=1 Tax=Providencia alcalifaciens TaxID=126385 RepID=A0A4R3NEN0_9GAMM|nr:hypothetical protein EC835_1175 [Providencia alcalifaciens]